MGHQNYRSRCDANIRSIAIYYDVCCVCGVLGMKKNKYDLLNDVAWLIFHSDECFKGACPLCDKCHDNDVPCSNVAKVHDELIKKYNLED